MTEWSPIARDAADEPAPVAAAPREDARTERLRRVAVALLAATMVFNPLLALVNGHIHRIGGGVVAGTQALIIVAALVVGFLGRPRPARWLVLAWALAMSFFLLGLLRGAIDPKNLGDALLVPAFICLGTALDDRSVIRLTTIIQALVVGVGLWEVLDPIHYGKVFKVLDYYVSTRGYDPSQFFAGGDLFVSSSRGGGRYMLPFTHWHRGSSLFLEPVSLGNWAAVIALFLGAYWDRFDWPTRAAWAGSIVATLIFCDGRLGLGVCAMLAVAIPLARRMPGWVSALYLPLFIIVLDILAASGFLPATGDTLSGRIRGGLDLLDSMDVAQFMGLGDLSKAAVDAGWVFLIENQSIFVALALWCCFTLSPIGESRSARAAQHGIALFVLLCMPISYAVFSVKTSGLMWALYGCFFQAEAKRRAAKKRERLRPVLTTQHGLTIGAAAP